MHLIDACNAIFGNFSGHAPKRHLIDARNAGVLLHAREQVEGDGPDQVHEEKALNTGVACMVMAYVGMAPCGRGLCSYGMCSYGLCNYGLGLSDEVDEETYNHYVITITLL